MPRLCTPDALCVEIDGPSRKRYNFRKGIADVSQEDAKGLLQIGAFPASLSGTAATGAGFVCACGFRSWFTTCSRCGGKAVRENAVQADG